LETWRRLDGWDGAPGWNMALDEALLGATDDVPVLRFYTWRPAALSLGYFQRFGDVPAARRAPAVVRRLTGGGAIHHERELTYSLAAPQTHPLFEGEVRASYERIHAALAEALAELGAGAAPRGDASLGSDRADTGMCFHASTPLDLAWSDAKGVGSAQRRTGGRVLHHGSIKLGATELDTGVAELTESDPRTVAEVVARALEGAFDCRLEPSAPTGAEQARAAAREAHFTSEAWLHRR
jgi:lipoate-protein ligase A